VHVFSGDGQWISFTYEDARLAGNQKEENGEHVNLRNIGVSVPAGPVIVDKSHPRNHDGAFFTVLISKTVAKPKPGSDEISKAFSDAWVGVDGYVKDDGVRQKKAMAFQGHVWSAKGEIISEVFITDLPDDMTQAAPGLPLEGTINTRPNPPVGVVQRRLTYTADRKYPGLQGPRHWLRSSLDGSQIAFLMKDDAGVVQLWTISPKGGELRQVTRNQWDIQSAFSWSPYGNAIAYVMDNSIFVTDAATGESRRITSRSDDQRAPSSLACVFSPDGKKIAYMRPVGADRGYQLFTADLR
jgi:WD40 repeat protein